MILVWKDYRNSCNKLTNQKNTAIPIQYISKSDNLDKELHVIVIGESTSASHMSLYGYNKNTNPRLNKLKKELIIFNNIHTEKVHTIESLQDVFTFPINTEKTSTLIDVFNALGYTTYWLSNQPFFEKSSTPITLISRKANDSKFLNPINSPGNDSDILNPFENFIKNLSKDKQIIILHLKGTHTPYDNTYPRHFKQFNGGNSIFGQEANEIINQYDNAILFNDYIITRLIGIIRLKKNYSISLTYFSDHGDEVYDKRDYFGHNQALLPSAQMTHVPCFIWLNDTMRKKSKLSFNYSQNKKQLKYISNTLLELYQIDFKLLPKQKSFFHN